MRDVQNLKKDKQPPTITYLGCTIDKKYVHRQAVNEVFITSSHQDDTDHFSFTAVMPKSHMYFNDQPELVDDNQYYDALLLLEIFRQTSICVTHKYYNVPLSAKFIFNDAKFDIINHHILKISKSPLSVTIEVKIRNHKYRRHVLYGYTLDMYILINNIPCAHKEMDIGWMESSVWKKLRSRHESHNPFEFSSIKPVSSISVGRKIQRNVVIGDIRADDNFFKASLIVDQSYSSIFDHTLDHVPGMFIIEACRQSALMAIFIRKNIKVNQLLFHACDISFLQFCELSCISECVINMSDIISTYNVIQVPVSVIQNDSQKTVGVFIFRIIMK